MTMPVEKPASIGLTENKKVSKPLIEKRRRARINHSLAQLKSIVVGPIANSPNGKPPKLEKADILEMTVRHLQRLHTELLADHTDDKYQAGISYCLKTVQQFMENNFEGDSKSKILDCLNKVSSSIISSENNSQSDLDTTMDDSSCSSNSRSETPSSTFTESSPMECHPCSPEPDCLPDSSSSLTTPDISSQFGQNQCIHNKSDSFGNQAHHSKACCSDCSYSRTISSMRRNPLHVSSRQIPLNLTNGVKAPSNWYGGVSNGGCMPSNNINNSNQENQNGHVLNQLAMSFHSVWRPW